MIPTESLEDATLRMLQESIYSDMLDELPTDYETKHTVDPSFVEGVVDDIIVVTDPDLDEEGYEELIARASELVEDTEEGQLPYSDEYIGRYLQTCPSCGQTFFTAEIIQPGGTCPLCQDTPKSFVMRGQIGQAEEVAADVEAEEEEKAAKLANKDTEESAEEGEPEEREELEASEEIKASDNKLEETKEVKTESVTTKEVINWHNKIEDAQDADEIQDIIYSVYDNELETELQHGFDQSIEDRDDLDMMKDFLIAILEDNAEIDD